MDTQAVVFSCVLLRQQRTAARLAAAAHDGELLARRTTAGHPASSHAARGVMSVSLFVRFFMRFWAVR